MSSNVTIPSGILAFNDPYHDSSFCVYSENELVHIEVERFTRVKFDSRNPLGAFCDLYIERLHEFDAVGVEEGDHLAPFINRVVTTKEVPDDLAELAKYVASAPNVRASISTPLRSSTIKNIRLFLRYLVDKVQIVYFCGHHEAHAANAFHSSGYNAALVCTLDGGGFDYGVSSNGQAIRQEIHGSIYRYSESECTLVEQLADISFGLAWFRSNELLGLSWGQEGTVMAMAALGDPERFGSIFAKPLFWAPNSIRLDSHTRQSLSDLLLEVKQQIRHEQDRYDFAASLQRATEERVQAYLRRFVTPEVANLCVAGGLFLNCQLLGKLPLWFPTLKNIYIPPAPYDGGISIGIAQKMLHETLGSGRRIASDSFAPFAMGRRYRVGEIRSACRQAGFSLRSARLSELIDLIDAGKIIALFSGAAESGRRALGHRSIIGDPRRAEIKDRINNEIKHRQWFRPLAPMVLAEYVSEWFDCPPGFTSPYMSFAIPVRPDRRAGLPAITHIDGSARVQTVHRGLSPGIHALLSEWHRRTALPILINTSFNDREPIVETPSDALSTFGRVPIDALYFMDFGMLVMKPSNGDKSDSSVHLRMRSQLPISRLDCIVHQSLSLRSELLSAVTVPDSVAERLEKMFTAGTRGIEHAIEPYEAIGDAITVGFQPSAKILLSIEQKSPEVASPDRFLNTVRIQFAGTSSFLTLEALIAWSELCDSQQFQLSLCAEPDRPVSCHAALRVYRHDASFLDLTLARFSLAPDRRNANKFGQLRVSDLLDIDRARSPILLVFFDTTAPLSLRIDFINAYFGR
jgi:carbamoyltransferase